MSRIGKQPVIITSGVKVTMDDNNVVTVKGPKGTLQEQIHTAIKVDIQTDQVVVTRSSDVKFHKSLHGLSRALINNMVVGVTNGFSKELEIQGVGYRAAKKGKKLTLTVGYSHPIEIMDTKEVTIDVPAPTQIIISGMSKQKVGAMAANIRNVRKPEPYKGKGIRYKGEYIIRKEGKAGA